MTTDKHVLYFLRQSLNGTITWSQVQPQVSVATYDKLTYSLAMEMCEKQLSLWAETAYRAEDTNDDTCSGTISRLRC